MQLIHEKRFCRVVTHSAHKLTESLVGWYCCCWCCCFFATDYDESDEKSDEMSSTASPITHTISNQAVYSRVEYLSVSRTECARDWGIDRARTNESVSHESNNNSNNNKEKRIIDSEQRIMCVYAANDVFISLTLRSVHIIKYLTKQWQIAEDTKSRWKRQSESDNECVCVCVWDCTRWRKGKKWTGKTRQCKTQQPKRRTTRRTKSKAKRHITRNGTQRDVRFSVPYTLIRLLFVCWPLPPLLPLLPRLSHTM